MALEAGQCLLMLGGLRDLGRSLSFPEPVTSAEDTEAQSGVETWQPANRKQEEGSPGLLAPPQHVCRPRQPLRTAPHPLPPAMALQGAPGAFPPGPREPLKGLSLSRPPQKHVT